MSYEVQISVNNFSYFFSSLNKVLLFENLVIILLNHNRLNRGIHSLIVRNDMTVNI